MSVRFTPRLNGNFMASWPLGANCHRLRNTGVENYTPLRLSLIQFHVAFSPNSQLLASSSGGETTKLWDPTTGELQQTLEGHSHSEWTEINVGISVLQGQLNAFRV